METITQIARRERSEIEKLSKTLCPDTRKSQEETRQLLQKFSPTLQPKCYAYPERSICGTAPTLAVVRRDYGEQVAVDWLTIQLNDYQNFVGVKEENKLPIDTLKSLSAMILGRYYFLKLSELMLFLQKLKYGDYVEMYGIVDAVKILKALRLFMEDRAILIDRAEQKRKEAERESYARRAVSYEKYKQMKKCEK